MYPRLLSSISRKKSFFLFGPRATGKTTWLKKQLKSAIYIDLLNSDEYLRFSSAPSSIEHIIPPEYKDWVIIDEIQRIPQLLNEVHRLIESRDIPFILTGSSARSLRKHGVNLLGVQIPVFTRRAKRRMTVHPKFYFFDVGVYQTIRPKGPLDSYSEISGASAEGLFLQDVRAVNSYLNLNYTIYFWRTSNGVEVDFVLYGEHGLKAFELKLSKVVRSKDMKGLKAFKQDYPEAETFLIYTGDRTEYHGDITAIPLSWALKNLDKLLKKT